MEVNKSPIKDLIVKLDRDNAETTNRLHIYVTIWTYFSEVEIKQFSKEDLFNLAFAETDTDRLGILKFNIHLVPSSNATILNKPTVVSKSFYLTNGENANFKFNEKINNIFLAEVIQLTKPTGTKRTVITYEDTDVIDDTLFTS